jgi:hypothetical protein
MPDQTPVKMSPDELAIALFTTGQSMTGGRPEAERLLKQIKDRAVSSVGQAPATDRTALREPAYEAVYAYIRSSNRVPGDVVTRNAMIWRAVTAALDAVLPAPAAPAAVVSGRAADETTPKPWQSDSARIGRTLIWSWSEIGKGAYGEGYRAAQAEARALLGGQRGTDADPPAAVNPQQPKQIRCDIAISTRQPHAPHDWTQRPDGPTRHCPGANLQQPTEADRTVAYRLPASRDLHCLACAPTNPGDIWTPVTAEDLEDGGLCVGCGVDVLIEQQPKGARP